MFLFLGDLLPFSSMEMQQKFAVAYIYKGKFLLANLQGNRMAKQQAEEKETADGMLVRKQYKVLFRLLIKDKRKNPNPKMSGISNSKHRVSRVLKNILVYPLLLTFLSIPGVCWSMLVLTGWLPEDVQCCSSLFITKTCSLLVTFYNSYHTVQSSYNCPNLVFSQPEVRKKKKVHSMYPLQLASLANIIIKQGFSFISLQVQQIPQHFSTAGKKRLEFSLFLLIFLNHHHSGFLGWALVRVSTATFFVVFIFLSHQDLRILTYVQ